MFSKSCEYAIRSVIIISQNSKQGLKTNVKEIATQADVPESYIAKVLQILTKAKLVNSLKGPGGGFLLPENHKDLMLVDIVLAIDGDSLFTSCGLGLKECSETNPCPLHDKFRDVRNDLKKMLTTTSISELSEKLIDFVYTSK